MLRYPVSSLSCYDIPSLPSRVTIFRLFPLVLRYPVSSLSCYDIPSFPCRFYDILPLPSLSRSVVERMSNMERQDLVYFWTSSPALPASEEGFQPMPTITIRPADDAHLPTANTCISRLYIPLYR